MPTHIRWELLSKYLAGECSAEEGNQVDTWIHAAPENEVFLTRMRDVWEATSVDTETAEPETDKVWANIADKIATSAPLQVTHRTTERRERPLSTLLFGQISRIAAMLVIGTLVGLASYWLYQSWNSDTLAYQYKETGLGEKATLLLPDGTLIYLNSNTRIGYPKTFGEKTREITLEGEAFFEIKPNPRKPFVIKTDESVVQVLGTVFNLRAYQQEDMVVCTVQSGKVALSDADSETNRLILTKGEQGVFNKKSDQLQKKAAENPNVLAWHTGKFVFYQTPLSQIAATLSAQFGTKITITNPALADCRVTVTLDQQGLQPILEVITLTLGIQYRMEGDQVLLSGEGCRR